MKQRRLGPILLAPGVTVGQIIIFLLVVSGLTFANSFMNMMQPLVLVQQLAVSANHTGTLAGMLATTQQFATLLFVASAGAWADVVGRRMLLVITLFGFAIGLFLFPLVGVVAALFLLRFAWGVVFTGFTAGGSTKTIDYPDNISRGKFVSLVLIVSGAMDAALLSGFATPLLGWLKASGFDAAQTSRYVFWAGALIILAAGLLALFGLEDDRPERPVDGDRQARQGVRHLFTSSLLVFRHARTNPRLMLILLIGFIIRSDGVVVSSFLGVWIVSAARDGGIDPIDATKTVGLLAAILSTSRFVSPLLFGVLADRMDRVKLLLFSMVLTTVAFVSFGLVSNVFGWGMIVTILLVGTADGAQQISAQALIAQEAPPELRGAAIGVFAFVGLISVIVINLIGGLLFDSVSRSAPFVMEGLVTFAFLIAALMLLRAQRRQAALT